MKGQFQIAMIFWHAEYRHTVPRNYRGTITNFHGEDGVGVDVDHFVHGSKTSLADLFTNAVVVHHAPVGFSVGISSSSHLVCSSNDWPVQQPREHAIGSPLSE